MLVTWLKADAFDQVFQESAMGLLSVGSCEQHSEYLPLGTDTLLGESLCIQAAERANARVLMLPVQVIGFSPHHRGFSGCITLSQDTMFRYLTEVCLCAYSNGLEKLLIVNSHGGNQSCLQTVVNELGAVHGKSAVLVRYWDLITDLVESIRKSKPGGMGHAGEFEVSLMLHYHPELVKKEYLGQREAAAGTPWHHPDMFAKNSVYIYKNFHEYSVKGNIGQPQLADAKEGEILAQGIVSRLVDLIDYYAENRF